MNKSLAFEEAKKSLEEYVNKGKISVDELIKKFEELNRTIS
jgi:exonuclease VII small subunit